MNAQAPYTPYHPKWYRRRVSVWWWLQKAVYTKFVLRELTSLFVAYFALLGLWKLRAVAAGPEAYTTFLARMKNPLWIFINSVALLFLLFHAITWFNLAPRAMVMRWGGKRLPDRAIQGMNYLAWLVISAGIAWFVLKG